MWLFIVGLLIGWVAGMAYYNAQADQAERDNTGAWVVAGILVVILAGFAVGNAAENQEAPPPTPTPTYGGR
jgi:hypothetical protein